MKRDLILVRHTEPDVAPGLCYGRVDVPLAPFAEESFQSTCEKISNELTDAPRFTVYTSPLSRCRILAKHISTRFSMPGVIEDGRLLELDFGEWEGRTWDEIHAADPDGFDTWARNFENTAPPGGESFGSLVKRVRELTGSLGSPSIFVTHAGVIRALVALDRGWSWGRAFRWNPRYGSVHVIGRPV